MKLFKKITLLFGILLFVWIVRKIGFSELLEGFKLLGWKLFIPVVVIIPCYIFYTISWQLFLKRFEHHSIPFWPLFRIKIAGEAANTLTPLNFAGGDPVRIWLLSKNFPVSISGASVVIVRTLQILAIVTLIFLGNTVAIFKLDLPLAVKKILSIFAVALLSFILLFLFYQSRGLFQKLTRLATKLKIRKFSDATLQKVKEMDEHISEFYRKDRRLFFLCFSLHFSARLYGTFELYLLGYFLGVPMGPWEALFFSAVIPVANLAGAIVPGNLGVLEGIVSSLFLALHWDPAQGLVLQMARRFRALVWIVFGMGIIFFFKNKEKSITTQTTSNDSH